MSEPNGGQSEDKPQEPDHHACPVCGRLLRSKQGLSAHLTRSHGYKRGVSPAEQLAARDRLIARNREATDRIIARDRPVDQGTGGSEVIRTNSDPNFQPQFQRPLDEDKLEQAEAGLQRMVDAYSYLTAVEAFLPRLAEEVRARRDQGLNDHVLTDAFFLLWMDAQASK